VYLVTSEQMQLFDKRTISTLCVPGIVLMEHAGRAVAEVVAARRPQRVVVCCGKGNNGGDGWIAARWLRHLGVPEVQVLSLVNLDALAGDARLAAEMARCSGVPYRVYDAQEGLPLADVYVDALLGTGSNRPITPDSRLGRWVAALNEASGWTVSVDVPSGIDASTGCVPGLAVRAQQTVCFAAQKLGTAISPGCEFAGEVQVADIGIAIADVDVEGRPLASWVTPEQVEQWLPLRGALSHKGTYGRVAVVVGQMQGAAVLAGLGAARAGCGLVVLVGSAPMSTPVPCEFVLRGVLADPISGADETALHQALADCAALVLGPGLGQAVIRWRQVIELYSGPVVVDADGLRLLDVSGEEGEQAENSGRMGQQEPVRCVLTPHPKECARLLGWTTESVQAHRLEAATTLAQRTHSVVVLKGYHSIICDPFGHVCVNPTGDASLATAGTGDVLAGIIGSLLAQGLSPFQAAAAGAWIHGRAGELAGQSVGRVSTMASDVVEHISRAIRLHFDR
jgi:hydroxyethylthiazole kinase-like uncharacterized protein yjeF